MYTVIVAGNEEELRRAIVRRINWEEIGFQVVGEAENGIEALELVEKLRPDLLLSDIRMPFISGIELARQVREVRPSTYIAFLSGVDDLSYAQQAIKYNIVSYLLKPLTKKKLTEELVKIHEKIDAAFLEFDVRRDERTRLTDFLIPLLMDEFRFQGASKEEDERRLTEQAEAFGFLREKNAGTGYVAVITSLYDSKGENCTSRGHIHSVDSILGKYLKCGSFYSGGKVVSLLAGTEQAFDKYLHIALEEVVQNVERILQKKCDIGVSRTADRLSACHEAYREAANACRYFEKTVSGIHYIADEEPVRAIDAEHISGAVAEVGDLLRSGTEQELKDYLDRAFDTARREKMPIGTLSLFLLQLLAEVSRSMMAMVDSEKGADMERYMSLQQMVMLPGTLDEVQDRISAFCLSARKILARQRKKSVDILCDRATQIIEKEFGNPAMSLHYVSGRVNVSPNYLSAVLKKNKGKSFVELLTAKRMEAAKEMLLSTSMKIKEISEKCGYSDQHYFSYCFKKYTGLSPGRFGTRSERMHMSE